MSGEVSGGQLPIASGNRTSLTMPSVIFRSVSVRPKQVHGVLLPTMSVLSACVLNVTLTTANTHNHSATSSTTESPAGCSPFATWQCSCGRRIAQVHVLDAASQ